MGEVIFKLHVLRVMVGDVYEEWRDSVWRRDLDSAYCCDGRECGCGAETVREMWSWYLPKKEATDGE